MTAVIIEDEIPAGIRLEKLLKNKGFEVLTILHSVKNAILWFQNNNHSDIVFVDVKLRDGNCFEILDKVKVVSKIVFTTAYDEFALSAFNYNSIDYLLKPLDENKLDRLILKIDTLKVGFESQFNWSNMESNLQQNYKTSFLVSLGNSLKKIEISEILYFYSELNSTYIFTIENRSFILNSSLDKLEDNLNPEQFFRISRKFIVHKPYILSLNNITKKINFKFETLFNVTSSKLKFKHFVEWYKK